MHIEKYTIRNSLNNLCKVNAFCVTSPQIKKVTIISISKEYLVSQLPPSLSKHRRLCWLLTVHLEKAMAPHSSTLAWKIPWMEKPGRLQSMESLGVWHDWALHFHFSLSCIGEGNGNPLQCSCLENPRDGEPGGLLSLGLHRVGHNWSNLAAAATLHFSFVCLGTFNISGHLLDHQKKQESSRKTSISAFE